VEQALAEQSLIDKDFKIERRKEKTIKEVNAARFLAFGERYAADRS